MSLRKIVGLLALQAFIGSAMIHLLTYSGINISERYPSVWALFSVVFVILGYTALTAQRMLGIPLGSWERVPLIKFLQQMPKWVRVVLAISFVYFMYNHLVFGMFGMIANPVPSEVDGKFIFNNHGHITEYSREQAVRAKLLAFRAWSGFWAWASLFSTLYLLTATRRMLPKR